MRLHKLQVWNRDETFWKCYPSKLTSLMAWAHGHHHPAGPGSLEQPHNLILIPTDLFMTEMLVRPPMDSTEVQSILSLPVITAPELFSIFITI